MHAMFQGAGGVIGSSGEPAGTDPKAISCPADTSSTMEPEPCDRCKNGALPPLLQGVALAQSKAPRLCPGSRSTLPSPSRVHLQRQRLHVRARSAGVWLCSGSHRRRLLALRRCHRPAAALA